jgi:hypothetical protein
VLRLLLMCSSQIDVSDISEAITLSDRVLHAPCAVVSVEKNCYVDGSIFLLPWRTAKEFYFLVYRLKCFEPLICCASTSLFKQEQLQTHLNKIHMLDIHWM